MKILGAELVELAVQSSNANTLAKFMDWAPMQLYVNLILVNTVVFSVCLLAPERLIGVMIMVAVDVIFGKSRAEAVTEAADTR